MTATAVHVPQQTGISEKEWVKLFPKEVIENYTGSLTFIKQLTVVAVSTITYLKNTFPEESYDSTIFGGLKLKILKNKCQDELAQYISTSMKQAFEAFDKKYVHQLALCFYSGDCSAANLVEYHLFEYAYTPEGVSMTVNTRNRDSDRRAMRCTLDAVHQLALCFYSGDCSAANLVEYHLFEYAYTPEGVSMTVNTRNRDSDRRAMRCTLDAVHQLALCFYSSDCSAENLVEYHLFEYAYTPEGVSMTVNTRNRDSDRRAMRCTLDAVKKRTATLLRSLSLYVWQNCTQPLPLNFDISLRLYYTEDAPEGYQAPGFAPSDEPDHLEATGGGRCLMGCVETPFHKFIARSFTRDLYSDSEAAQPSDNVPEMTQDREDFDGRCARSPGSQKSADWQASADGQSSADGQASADWQASADSQASAAPALRCPCTNTDVVDEFLVTCRYCHTQQHAACFGLLGPVAEHCCEACAPLQPGRRASCPLLVGLEGRKQESLCIFRRTLMLCSRQSALSGEELLARFGLTATSASKMLRLLQHYSVLPRADAKDLAMPTKIDRTRLKQAFKHFFRESTQEDYVVERLMAETEQDVSDPVGDVLSPLEKVTLRNSSNHGTTWQTVAPTVPDPTLQQYRDVLVPNDEVTDHLPLSGDHNPVKDVERIGRKAKRRKADDDDEDWKPSKLAKLRSGAKTKKKI